MVRQVLEGLGLGAHLKSRGSNKSKASECKCIIDATVGTGGHALAMIRSGAFVLGIDVDKRILEIAKRRLKRSLEYVDYKEGACPVMDSVHGLPFKLVNGNFSEIDKIAKHSGLSKVDGILLDLGISSLHFDKDGRGFSFSDEKAKLDMRLSPETQGVTAADIVNSLRKDQLETMFGWVMSFPEARRLAKQIVLAREEQRIKTVGDFLEIIERSEIGRRTKSLHPATLPFLALRIATNSELENLKKALPKAFSLLKKKARLVVISFHSGEDSIVKKFFKEMEESDKGRVLTKKPLVPDKEEIRKNPRARSAKLRVLEKTIN